jgi:hypothetical protein
MTVAYEAVLIKQGTVGGAGPTGFTTLHYDNSPSPLTIAGGGSSSIFGTGGLVQGGISALSNIANGNPGGILEAINIYRNYRTGGYGGGAGEEINGIIKRGIQGIRTTNIGGSSSPGVVFPRKQRQVKPDAVLTEKLDTTYRIADELPNVNTPDNKTATDPQSNDYAVSTDNTRLLTPEETYVYFKNNHVALDGLARDYVYRTEQQNNDNVNTAKTDYDELSETVKSSYRAKALGKSRELAEAGQINLVLPVNQINEITSIANNELGSYTISVDGDTVTETYTDDDGVVTTYNNSAV